MQRREVLVSAREVIAIKLLGTTLLLRLTGFTVLNLCVLLCLALPSVPKCATLGLKTQKKMCGLISLYTP